MIARSQHASIRLALLVCASILTLSACRARSSLNNFVLPAESLLTIWHAVTPEEAEILQGLANAWAMEQESRPRIELVDAPSEEALHQRLVAAIQAESPPDLAFIRPSDLAGYVEADALLPLDHLIGNLPSSPETKSDFYLHFFEGNRVPQRRDALYTWPLHRHQTLMFVNLTRANELDLEMPPSSWEGMSEMCETHLAEGGESCLAAFPTGEIAVLWLWSWGGELLGENGQSPVFRNKAGRSMLQWIQAMRKKGGIYRAPTYEASVEAFSSGATLFAFDSTEALPRYEGKADRELEIMLLPPPTVAGEPVTLLGGDNVAVFRNDRDESQEALATDFLQYLTSTDVNYQWANAIGAYPVRRSSLEQLLLAWPAVTPLREAARTLPYARSQPARPDWPELTQTLAGAIIGTITGEQTPEEALNHATQNAWGILKHD